jgi:hydroxymethylpyrimidine pyrophosphatase-like HAD family hydrolase
MCAGDSGNDVHMLGGKGPACVVANAQPELLDWVMRQPQSSRLIVCDAPLAKGVLQGLARHGLY